jgi:ElaB/YqjD/DUF883 family membrane-anchored ribosome-binding protein
MFAQKTASEYLADIPTVPGAPCERDDAAPQNFKEDINKVIDELSKDIAARNKKAKDFMKDHEKQARETAVKNSGLVLTPEQMKVMQQENKHMTQAQKDKLANEVMQQNMNVSMAELDRLKKGGKHVDSTAAANWAQGFSTELNAEREINPEKAQAAEIRNKQTNDLVKEMNDTQQRLYAGEDKYTQQLNDLQYLADSLYRILRMHTDPMHAEADTIQARLAREKAACNCAMEEASKKVFDRVNFLLEEIQTLEYMYCPPLTNKYLEILGYYHGYIETTFTSSYRLEELQAEIQYRQTGIKDPEFKPGLLALQAVHHYAELVSNVYRYKISDRPLNDEEKKQLQTIGD